VTTPTSPDDPGWNDPQYPEKPAPSKSSNVGGWIVLAVIVFTVWACVASADTDTSAPGDDPETDEYTAIAACERSVEAQLRAPATAEFSNQVASRGADGSYEVRGNVDSENGFGAMLRSSWTCSATPTTDGYRGLAVLT